VGANHTNMNTETKTTDQVNSAGIFLRDYFAGLAMQALLAPARSPTSEVIASWAYEMADAMLAERDKGR
jgi:hypothetical protein